MAIKIPLWLRYGFPSFCAIMGTWQVYRLAWKTQLINDIEKGLHCPPIKLESIPADLDALKYKRVRLVGDPDPCNEDYPIFLGPRGARDINIDFAFNFIAPFRLRDGGRVLVDYGRVPLGQESNIKLPFGQDYIEVLWEQNSERRAIGMERNNVELGRWLYRDIDSMAEKLNCIPLMFKRIARKPDSAEYPIPSYPKLDIPNRHLEYIITWYSVAALSYLLGFLKK